MCEETRAESENHQNSLNTCMKLAKNKFNKTFLTCKTHSF